MKSLPKRKIEFKLRQNTYICEFPNTGGLIDIEINKAIFAKNYYESISSAATIQSAYVRFLIDAMAVITITCPQLRKDLKVQSFTELDPMDSKELLQAYMKEILPWMKEWDEVLNSDDSEIESNGEPKA